MGSVIFDFDSTLVPVESLEEICARAPGATPEIRAELARITNAGMDGSMAFEESLRSRIALVPPRREHVAAVGAELARSPTAGASGTVSRLRANGHEAWIVSGGFRDLIQLVAEPLGIPEDRAWGVGTEWNDDGTLRGMIDDGFSRSKLEGIRRGGMVFARPAVGVGDGATDLALQDAGVVDHFVAYTEHVRRERVVERADYEARSMQELAAVLETLLA